MKGKNLERFCVACGKYRLKPEMLRVVKTESGVLLDESHKIQGRGAYVCNDKTCIALAVKKKAFKRFLGGKDSEALYGALRARIDE